MTILVTGASGFLGLNLVKYFAAAHPETSVYGADLVKPLPAEIAALNHFQGQIKFGILDVTDQSSCSHLFHDLRPTHVIHAAAATMIGETQSVEQLVRGASYHGTGNLLKAARTIDLTGRIIVLSSSAVYRQTEGDTSCGEEHPLDLGDAYSLAKYDAELAVQSSNRSSPFLALAARIGPVYGPFERLRPMRPQVSLVCRLLHHLQQQRVVRISGEDISRDWTYAADVAQAIDLLLYTPRLNHEIYNVSSGRAVCISELLGALTKRGLSVSWTDASDVDIAFQPQDARKAMCIKRLVGDTGFSPQFDVESGLADLIATEAQYGQLQEEDSQ